MYNQKRFEQDKWDWCRWRGSIYFFIENEDVIDREVTENKPETNRDTLKEVIEECPDNQDDDEEKELLRTKMKV